jgi:fluoride ion exporter CrcB/FEX
LGGFTTFSSFNVDIFELIQNGSILISILYIIGTFALTVGAFFLGMSLLRIA